MEPAEIARRVETSLAAVAMQDFSSRETDNLSGGQKQRVAIARTLMKDNDILIFDDSLSAVDTETDAQIRKALKTRSRDTTTIIISHRIVTLSQADLILVMEDGHVTEQGTHEQLIHSGGLYSRIFSIQSALEEEFKEEKRDYATV
jgi:ATP-binding cassette subfamily B protein